MTALSFSFSFSSSIQFHSLPLPTKTPTTTTPSILILRCTVASTSAPPKKKIWKQGEYPGRSQFSIPKEKRTPIKNIKKKLDKKNNAKGWANTVTEALSEHIEKKQWLQALEVLYLNIYLLCLKWFFFFFFLCSSCCCFHFLFLFTMCGNG